MSSAAEPTASNAAVSFATRTPFRLADTTGPGEPVRPKCYLCSLLFNTEVIAMTRTQTREGDLEVTIGDIRCSYDYANFNTVA